MGRDGGGGGWVCDITCTMPGFFGVAKIGREFCGYCYLGSA